MYSPVFLVIQSLILKTGLMYSGYVLDGKVGHQIVLHLDLLVARSNLLMIWTYGLLGHIYIVILMQKSAFS